MAMLTGGSLEEISVIENSGDSFEEKWTRLTEIMKRTDDEAGKARIET